MNNQKKIKKITTGDTWDIKYLRKALWMPFGSMCNLVGQAYQGKEINSEELEVLTKKIFELAMEFTEDAYKRIERQEPEEGIEIPIKKK